MEGIEAATLHPARVLGITDTKGTLDPGSDADFVVLSDETEAPLGSIDVRHTYIAGKCVYTAPGRDRQQLTLMDTFSPAAAVNAAAANTANGAANGSNGNAR